MRTLLRPLAASTVLILLTLAPASAQERVAAGTKAAPPPHAEPRIRLVQVSARPAADGKQTVRYAVFQQVEPLLAVAENGVSTPDVLVSTKDVVEVSYELENAGWEQMGVVTVEHLNPGAQAPAKASVTASADGEPAAPQVLALAPVRPNPVSGRALVVDVALPSDRPARLELLDIMGRVVASRDLAALGVGRHAVDLSAGPRSLAPGVYMLRLTQGAESRVTRVAVID